MTTMVASIKGVWREADVQMYPCEEQCSVDSKNFEGFKMATWKILKDGVEIARINPDIDCHKIYVIAGALAEYAFDRKYYWPLQIKGKESDFGILLKDGSYLKAELVKEPTLESWFNSQNFGDEFQLFPYSGYIDLKLEREGENIMASIVVIPEWLPLDRQKRIIEKHIKLYK